VIAAARFRPTAESFDRRQFATRRRHVAVLDDFRIDFSANMIRGQQGYVGCLSSALKSFGKATHQSSLTF
jgi:hypothetical protein